MNSASVWGLDAVAFDQTVLTSGVTPIASEFDTQPQNPSSAYSTVFGAQVSLFMSQSGTVTGSKALLINHGQSGLWDSGIYIDNGNVGNFAAVFGALCGTGTCDSATVQFKSLSSSSQLFATSQEDSSGNFVITPSSGEHLKLGTGRIMVAGSTPSCTFSSGGGTSRSCTLDTGSGDSAGIIIATTGSGSPSGTGTITLTFSSSPFGTNKPVCEYQASDNGAGKWNGLTVMKDKSPSTSSDLFTWTNGATPTVLSA